MPGFFVSIRGVCQPPPVDGVGAVPMVAAFVELAAFIAVCCMVAGTTGCAVVGWVGIMFNVLPAGAAALGTGGGAVCWCFEQAPITPAIPSNVAITKMRFISEISCCLRTFMVDRLRGDCNRNARPGGRVMSLPDR